MIGSGKFGSVYAAHWKSTKSKYAIKKFIDSSIEEITNEVWYY